MALHSTTTHADLDATHIYEIVHMTLCIESERVIVLERKLMWQTW
jgi:hypothetical protein